MKQDDILWEEYKILQDKIDNFGAFRFRIKGWVVSLVTAVLLAGAALRVPWFVTLLALPIIGAFQLYESNQRLWRTAFTTRIQQIESNLRRKGIDDGVDPRDAAPRITVVVGQAHNEQQSQRFGRIVLWANATFYTVLYLVVVVIALLMEIGGRGIESTLQEVRILTPVEVAFPEAAPINQIQDDSVAPRADAEHDAAADSARTERDSVD